MRVIEEIAVKVNGDIITRGDLADKERLIRQSLQQQEHLRAAPSWSKRSPLKQKTC